MKLFCSHCMKPFPVPEADIPGGKTKCPECGGEIAVPQTAVAPGVVIADFWIEKLISTGGMGEVYLARQLSLDRPVALKVLQSKFINDKEYVDSLFREARAAAKISHPNIVQAYAVGEEDGIFYFAMEYVRGDTFKKILKEQNGKLEFKQAAKVILEVAGALGAAWKEQKLVHQDIKPDNIMLDGNGFAKLADMGLAKTAGMPPTDEDQDEVLGTPQYISPEQLTGVPTDVRSDIYSLGATFYQFVTGRFPYVGTNAEDITKQHVEGNLIPPKEINPELPEELNRIIVKMMALHPEERYQTPEPLVADLQHFLLHADQPPAEKSKPKITLTLPKHAAPPKLTAPAKPAKSPAPKLTAPVVPPKPAVPKLAVPPKPAASKTAPAVPPKPAASKTAPAVPPKPAVPKLSAATEKTPLSPALPSTPEKKTDAAPPKANHAKSRSRWIWLSSISLIVLLIVSAVTLIVLEAKSATPDFLQPLAAPLHSLYRRFTSKAVELSKPTIATAGKEDLPTGTRPDFLAAIDGVMESRENASLFLHNVDQHWHLITEAFTPDEKEAADKMAKAFSPVDEIERAAKGRVILREKHRHEIAQRQDARNRETRRREEAASAEARAKEAARQETLRNEQKFREEMEIRRRETEKLSSKLDSFYRRLSLLAVEAVWKDRTVQWNALSVEISNDLTATPLNDDQQRGMVRDFENFRRQITVCIDDAREKMKLFYSIGEEDGIHLPTSRGMSLLVSLRDGKVLCRRDDIVFELDLNREQRARKMICSSLNRKKIPAPEFYLGLLTGNPEIVSDADVPQQWRQCWPKIKEVIRK